MGHRAHRADGGLLVSAGLAAGLAGAALLCWPASSATQAAQRRVRSPLPSVLPAAAGRPQPWMPHCAAALAFVASTAVAWPAGLVIGAIAAAAVEILVRRAQPGADRSLRRRRERALPEALRLIAIALRAGQPPTSSFALVSAATGGPLSDQLAHVAALTALGASPSSSWQCYADDPVLGRVARAVSRASESGSALASTFERLAADTISAAHARAEASARRAGVLVMVPLGLCFLPAFVCIGIAPVVISIVGHALH
ncbi:MAG: hypothetical protein DLM56_14440 [Pseudonocardiales bacterium]|nr:MAG: hypothetical protein DLM56_14440 [Pseudonocardiales bacterium]